MNNSSDPDHKKYEYFCIDEHRKEFPDSNVQIWNNIAENDLIQSGWVDYLKNKKLSPSKLRRNRGDTINPYTEYGLDGLAKYKDNFDMIQVKYYNPTSYIGLDKLKTFMEIVKELNHIGYLYHIGKIANKTSLNNVVLRSPQMNSEYSIEDINTDSKYDAIEEERLWDHQKVVLKIMRETDYKQMKSLQLPPGVGKTDLCGVFIKGLKNKYVIVFNELIGYVEQNHQRLTNYIKNLRNPYIINSESSCTVEHILEDIKTKGALINITFDSFHLIKDIEQFKDAFFIIDESHRMSNDMIEYLKDKEGFCMSGTCSEKVTDVFPLFYSMNLKEAIEKKIVTDYKIYIPLIDQEDDHESGESDEIQNTIVDKVDFLLTGMMKTGARYNITYLTSTNDCFEYKKLLEERANSDIYNVSMNIKIVIGKTDRDDRKEIYNSYRENEQNGIVLNIILSIHILSMAIDLKLCDSVYFTQESKIKNTALFVQRICRGNRVVKDDVNKYTRVFIYGTEDDFFKDLTELKNYDSGFCDKVSKISGDYERLGGKNLLVEKEETVDMRRRIVDIVEFRKTKYVTINDKVQILIDFVNEFNKIPLDKEVYKGINIGSFWGNIKRGTTYISIYKSNLSKIKILRDNYEDYQIYKENKIEDISIEEKGRLLIDFVDKNLRTPKNSEIIGTFKISLFWTSIKSGINKNLYESTLSKNEILKNDYERYIRIKKSKPVYISINEKADLLLKFVKENSRVPVKSEKMDSFKVEDFWKKIKYADSSEIYNSVLCKNSILKDDYLKYKNYKKNKAKTIAINEKGKFLLQFVEDNSRVPFKTESAYGFDIGAFWGSIKQKNSKDLYETMLSKNSFLQSDYDKVDKMRENKTEVVSIEEKCELLLKYVEEYNRVPSKYEIYKNVNIGNFWGNTKQGGKKDLYDSTMSKNIILKNDYEKVLKMKESTDVKLTYDEKANLLLKYVEKYKKVPNGNVIVGTFKLGMFWGSIKQGRCKDLYDTKLSKCEILKNNYDTVVSQRKKSIK